MSWQTNPALMFLRTISRKAGLTKVIGSIILRNEYEHAFDDALFKAIREGDVVWDVGANIGYYTRRFSEAVGPAGHVIAFEPFPETAERLRAHVDGVGNCTLCVKALGAAEATVTMATGGDELGATNRIVEDARDGVEIRVVTGDSISDKGEIPTPNILKIDTEGFELDVLSGMKNLITSSNLRAVFVEVHFGLLEKRAQPKAPAQIEKLLKEAGFVTRWVDPSHIAATRG